MDGRARGYGTTARLLHWLVALLILLMIPAGYLMTGEGLARGTRDALFLFHKNVGAALIAIVALRLVWRLTHPPAPLPAHLPGWQRRAAGLSHAGLYVLMVVMPLSGYVRVRAGGFPIEALDRIGLPGLVPRSDALAQAASNLHAAAAWGLIALLALHLAAAAQHALIHRDGIWQRIWPPIRRG